MEKSDKPKLQIGRLRQLARLLRRVPKERFNMYTWADGKFCNITKPSEALHTDCKTTACALGWACTIPSFKAAGLRMRKKKCVGWNGKKHYDYTPYYKTYDNSPIHAGKLFFGLTNQEADKLFTGRGSANKVADRIESVIEKRLKK